MTRALTLPSLDTLTVGWRGPVLAAFVALLAGLPSLFMTPILDRQEARTVQATAERIEAREAGVALDQPWRREEAGTLAHALQAVSVQMFSQVEDRDIRPYRLPSLLGAMLAAWACAWGATALWGARIGFLAGGLLGATFLLSTLAGVATAQALGAGFITLMMAALGRLYVVSRQEGQAGRLVKLAFWTGLSASLLTTGLTGVVVLAATVLTLVVADRDARFLRRIGWGWGLPLLMLAVGPWLVAATVASDGDLWGLRFFDTPLGRLIQGRAEWSPPGAHLLIAPLLLFPATLIAPAALMTAATRRDEAGVRFAAAWLIPAWILFELSPDKHWAQTLPLFGAVVWLGVAALTRPLGRVSRLVGTALAVVGGLYVLGAALYGLSEFGGAASRAWATPTIGLTLAAAGIGGFLMFHRMPVTAILASMALGVLAHLSLAGVAGSLEPLSVSPRLDRAMRAASLHPLEGRYAPPPAVAGYDQPSAVFLLGAELTSARGAAEAVAEGRTAVVDERLDADFSAALSAMGVSARRMGEVSGFNYVNGDDVALTLYAPDTPAAAAAAGPSR